MENDAGQERAKKSVNVYSWVLIIASVLILLKSIFSVHSYSNILSREDEIKNLLPGLNINYTFYVIKNIIGVILSLIVLFSASFVILYKEFWRKVLIVGLQAIIIYLLIIPVINYFYFPLEGIRSLSGLGNNLLNAARIQSLIFSYFISVLISAFLVFVIVKFRKDEVKLLFH